MVWPAKILLGSVILGFSCKIAATVLLALAAMADRVSPGTTGCHQARQCVTRHDRVSPGTTGCHQARQCNSCCWVLLR